MPVSVYSDQMQIPRRFPSEKAFQKDILRIKKDDFPKADLENYLSQIIVGNPQRTFLKDRMSEKLPESKVEFINNMKKEKLDLPYLYNLINLQKLVPGSIDSSSFQLIVTVNG